MVIKNVSIGIMVLLFQAIIPLSGIFTYSAQTENIPVIHIDKTTPSSYRLFEGDELKHTFAVFNRGTADLKIKKITHS